MKSRFLLVGASCLLWFGLALAQVNINTATRDQLDALKGIGPSKAQAIIDYRKKNGPFRSVDELENVPGIGPATLKELRGDVAVSGASRSPVSAPAAVEPRKESSVPPYARPLERQLAPASRPVTQEPARPAAPAMPARPVIESKAAPATPSASVAPARPAMPAKPAAPIIVPEKPAAHAATVPAQAAPPLAKPAAPAQPARPARPAVPD